jgi:hypothetical protein
MDVEYQKKEITWCLDREGPSICLRAAAVNNKLDHLELTCDAFKLRFEKEEAREFLEILQRIMREGPPSDLTFEDKTPLEEFIEQPIVESIPSIIEEPVAEKIPQIEEPSIEPLSTIVEEPKFPPKEVIEELDTLGTSSKVETLDTSEILAVLKQSESMKDDEIPSLDTQEVDSEAFKSTAETIELYRGDDVSTPGISIEEHVKPSSLFDESVDKASFFRTPEENDIQTKSPLEQLLESEDEKVVETVDQEDISLKTLETELNALSDDLKSYTPQDLASSTFISDFEKESEDTKIFDSRPETQIVKEEISPDEPEPTGTYSSELERRSKIEKERAARKKRLWELTRGF